MSDGENDDEEELRACKKKQSGWKKPEEEEAKDWKQVTKRSWPSPKVAPSSSPKMAPKPSPASTRSNKKSERAVWTEAAQQSKWKVKDATGKNSAAAPSTQKSWVDDWSYEQSSWDEEWSSGWDEDCHWADNGYGGWSQQRAAPRDAGRKLQCQFHIQIEEEPEFRVCRRLLGPAGKHMKAIAEKTGSRLRLRGRGSRFREGPNWQESDDPLMLCVSAVGRSPYDQAVKLVRELLEGIYQDYAAFNSSNPSLKIYLHEGAREGSGVGR